MRIAETDETPNSLEINLLSVKCSVYFSIINTRVHTLITLMIREKAFPETRVCNMHVQACTHTLIYTL